MSYQCCLDLCLVYYICCTVHVCFFLMSMPMPHATIQQATSTASRSFASMPMSDRSHPCKCHARRKFRQRSQLQQLSCLSLACNSCCMQLAQVYLHWLFKRRDLIGCVGGSLPHIWQHVYVHVGHFQVVSWLWSSGNCGFVSCGSLLHGLFLHFVE